MTNDFTDAYRKPLQQNVVSVSLGMPIIDWGLNKGKVNMGRENLNTVNVTAKQTEQAFEQDVLMTVYKYNLRQTQIQSSEEAKQIAVLAYNKTTLYYRKNRCQWSKPCYQPSNLYILIEKYTSISIQKYTNLID